jgi:hypothetical protein
VTAPYSESRRGPNAEYGVQRFVDYALILRGQAAAMSSIKRTMSGDVLFHRLTRDALTLDTTLLTERGRMPADGRSPTKLMMMGAVDLVRRTAA